MEKAPTPVDAARGAERSLGAAPVSVERFPTGLAHVGYGLLLADGRRVVVGMARRGPGAGFAALGWHRLLAVLGDPLAPARSGRSTAAGSTSSAAPAAPALRGLPRRRRPAPSVRHRRTTVA